MLRLRVAFWATLIGLLTVALGAARGGGGEEGGAGRPAAVVDHHGDRREDGGRRNRVSAVRPDARLPRPHLPLLLHQPANGPRRHRLCLAAAGIAPAGERR